MEHGGDPERRLGTIGEDERTPVGHPAHGAFLVSDDVAGANRHTGRRLCGEHRPDRVGIVEPFVRIGTDEEQSVASGKHVGERVGLAVGHGSVDVMKKRGEFVGAFHGVVPLVEVRRCSGRILIIGLGRQSCGTPMGQDWVVTERATWAEVSRSLRAAHGLAQEDWAAWLDVSRKTVQRWERGVGAPDDRVEERLALFCAERAVFARVARGTLSVGVRDWQDLGDVLARSRRMRAPRPLKTDGVERSMVGRDADLAAVEALVGGHRLVSITGPGGVGKTTLAQAVVTRASNSALLVELAHVGSADLVLGEIAGRAGAAEAGGASIRDVVVRALSRRPLLLVLDNFEHLPDAIPSVGDLLGSCPLLRVLATSRTPLRLSIEVEHRLAPLSSAEVSSPAVSLFVHCARHADPGFVDDDTTRALVRDICMRLDGLPLAIELAAARLRSVTVQDLHARINRSLAVLAGGARDRPARQQSMRASLAWSHDLLDPTEQQTLRRLAWFRGGFTLAAAEAVADESAFADVASLVDHGFLARHSARYAMLETVREFVVEQAAQPDTIDDGARFITWASELGVELAGKLRGAGQQETLDAFDDELANLRVALQCCLDRSDGAAAHRLAGTLAGFWDGRSMLSEARRWLELTLACPGAHPVARATLLNWLAYFAALQRDLTVADRHARAALVIWTEHDIELGIGYARLILGRVAAEHNNLDTALDELRDAERCMRAAGDRWGLVRPINALGELAREKGNLNEARTHHEEARDLCRELGEEGSLPSILADLAHVALDLHDPDTAKPAAEEALAIATRLGNAVGVATALDVLGRCRLASGDPATAIALWAEADTLRHDLHHPRERRDRQALERDQRAALDQLAT